MYFIHEDTDRCKIVQKCVSGSGGAGSLRGVGAGAVLLLLLLQYNARLLQRGVSRPGPSGVKSHTGSANAATAPSPALRNIFGLILTNTFRQLGQILLVSFRYTFL